jgi:hypothetical protein
MKIFRVVTERDGDTIKAPGISETSINQINRRYVAETIQQVWAEIEDIQNDPEEHLIAVIEEFPAVKVITTGEAK